MSDFLCVLWRRKIKLWRDLQLHRIWTQWSVNGKWLNFIRHLISYSIAASVKCIAVVHMKGGQLGWGICLAPNAHYRRSSKNMAGLNSFSDGDGDAVAKLPSPHILYILTFSNEKQQQIAMFAIETRTSTVLQSRAHTHTHTREIERKISCPIDLNNLHVCIDGSRIECIFHWVRTWRDKQLHMDSNLCAYAFSTRLMVMTAL